MDVRKIIFFLAMLRFSSAQAPTPANIAWNWKVERFAIAHIVNLTQHLVKDTTLKLRHAEKVQEKHKHSITYELGTIAAGILDRFKRMLEIYRTITDEKTFFDRKFSAEEHMQAFHYAQGEYNEIRLEVAMFYDIVRVHESTIRPTKFSLPPGFTLPPDFSLPPDFEIPPGAQLPGMGR